MLPYYGYARQDRKDQGRVPITAKLVADLLTVAGADRVLALDLHAAQIQGFFDIPVDHLTPARSSRYVRSLNIPPRDFVVLSPDEGSIKKALMFQKKLGGTIAIVDKRRSSATETKQANLIGARWKAKSPDLRRHDLDGRQRGRRRQCGPAHGAREFTPAPRTPCCAARPSSDCVMRRSSDRRDRQHSAAAGKALPKIDVSERVAAAGRRHQTHPL